MSKGWILLHRQIQDCWLWNERPFSKGQAWVDLLLLANHKEKKLYLNGELTILQRGQFHTSLRKLALRWGWNVKTVKRFLDVLEHDQMLSQNCTNRGNTLTIVNYDNFQDIWNTDGYTKGNTKGYTVGNTDGIQTNNVKNENNENKKSSAFIPPSLEDVKAYCQERNNQVNPQAFIDFYESKGWMIGKNKMKNWKSAVHTWENREPKKASKTMGKQNFDTFTDLYKN